MYKRSPLDVESYQEMHRPTSLRMDHVHFDGVFACDHLPTKPRLMVCNTDKSDEPGEHWIAIYVDDDGRYGEYFDPLGRAPISVFERYVNVSEKALWFRDAFFPCRCAY